MNFEENRLFMDTARDCLLWIEEAQTGYFPVTAPVYDQAYFDRYEAQADSEIGRALNAARCELVARHWGGVVLDVGIGSGAFLKARGDMGDKGFDVNPAGVEWLQDRDKYGSLYAGRKSWGAVTFWDSLEHMDRPDLALDCVKTVAFVSLPIFRDAAHARRSKHFRPDEHVWYWTRWGFIEFARRFGFEVVEHNTMESLAGREDIETFVLSRRE